MFRPFLILGWAIFLASSWTWCIGMFLPVLLVRDMGLSGWIVFAIPNILGAAAMGWVLTSDQSSRQLVERHPQACAAFSLVTIAFHVFFITWFVGTRLLNLNWWFLAAAVALWVLLLKNQRAQFFAASGMVYLLSLLAMGMTVLLLKTQAIPHPPLPPANPASALFLAPVCFFGFFFCPYLDLTFHRARQANSPWAARAAFSLGFGLFFLVMILFSLIYARPLAGLLQPGAQALPEKLAQILGIHLLAQSGLTVGLHARELAALPRAPRPLVAGLLLIAATLAGLYAEPHRLFGLAAGEVVYRLFMAFYGLIFPAYVWLCILPSPTRQIAPARTNLLLLAAAVLLACPFFFLGFILNKMLWLLPGLALVLFARLLVPKR